MPVLTLPEPCWLIRLAGETWCVPDRLTLVDEAVHLWATEYPKAGPPDVQLAVEPCVTVYCRDCRVFCQGEDGLPLHFPPGDSADDRAAEHADWGTGGRCTVCALAYQQGRRRG